jgi:hypothetical protein
MKRLLHGNWKKKKLRDFDRTKLVEDFRKLEAERRQLAPALIRARHSAQLP